MLSIPDRMVSAGLRLFGQAPEQRLQRALTDSALALEFFEKHPVEFATFLQQDFSNHLRTAHGEARTAIDRLTELRSQLQRAQATAVTALLDKATLEGDDTALASPHNSLIEKLATLTNQVQAKQKLCEQLDALIGDATFYATTILAEATQVPGIESHISALRSMATAITANQAAQAEIADFRATELSA